ncbi:UDP-glucose 4-epimerase [Actinomadura rubrobrunea]|uniref:UDP-glucose 4-epimerase n=1 Tax=Actinomadura rubrobrunea TaxID=115335 RepID=A0A9W6UWR5_9ACTN|nr:NAD-dependent epimerase/dehydratase family protein [Actinomadura rubrobrunea]GLW63950.1 UDP-glucose 4-epimerase [Actinomadura rubrobrunea]
MHVLVTGGAGFIGSRVVSALLADGHRVRVLDALLPEVHDTEPALPDDVEFMRGDVRDEDTVRRALRGVDAVSHHAAMVGRGREILDARRYADCNDVGTATLLVAMTEAGVERLALASSVVVYGEGRYRCREHGLVRPPRRAERDLAAGRFEPRCPRCGRDLLPEAIDEDDPLSPAYNVYAVTKLAQENLVAAWATETGGSAAALRYHSVYGPGMLASTYTGVSGSFHGAVVTGRPPRVFEDGRSRRDFVHVDDAASANVLALRHAAAGFRAYNVGSGTPHTIYEVARTLSEAAGAPEPVVTGEYRVADMRHIYGSTERITRELGWRPRVDFTAGIREFALSPMRTGAAAAAR